MRRTLLVTLAGVAAGFMSGLFGVGGGIVMVPVLVWALRVTQHEAHATSLLAIVPIAVVGAAVFASDSKVDASLALPLALGSILGAPLGAWAMRKAPEGPLKAAFGAIGVVVGIVQVMR